MSELARVHLKDIHDIFCEAYDTSDLRTVGIDRNDHDFYFPDDGEEYTAEDAFEAAFEMLDKYFDNMFLSDCYETSATHEQLTVLDAIAQIDVGVVEFGGFEESVEGANYG